MYISDVAAIIKHGNTVGGRRYNCTIRNIRSFKQNERLHVNPSELN